MGQHARVASPEPASTPALGRAAATRAALVELAAELFAERGYEQTSVRDISRRGALTTGAIYGHFRNKADLLAEAISVETAAQLEAQTLDVGDELDHVEALARVAAQFAERRRLRALTVQGAAAAQTDDETRARLRDEQLSHINTWLEGYEAARDRLGIDGSVDLEAFVLLTWAIELGLGVLESFGIEPRSAEGWADVHNRLARGIQLPPDDAKRPVPRRVRRRTAPP
jgi:AcrR family transcriptional regulator